MAVSLTIATTLRNRLARLKYSAPVYRTRMRLARYRRAYRYATGRRIDHSTASYIIAECQDAVGWWPLETFSIDGVLDTAAEYYEPHPELERLALDACARVHDKWSPTCDDAAAAEDWACDLIGEYAEQEGIVLTRIAPAAA